MVTCNARLEGLVPIAVATPHTSFRWVYTPSQHAYSYNCIRSTLPCLVTQGTVYPERLPTLVITAGLLVSKMRGNSKEGQNTFRSERKTRSSPSLSISTSDEGQEVSPERTILVRTPPGAVWNGWHTPSVIGSGAQGDTPPSESGSWTCQFHRQTGPGPPLPTKYRLRRKDVLILPPDLLFSP